MANLSLQFVLKKIVLRGRRKKIFFIDIFRSLKKKLIIIVLRAVTVMLCRKYRFFQAICKCVT